MVSVHLRLSKALFSQIDFLQKEFGFNSVQELIRDAVRAVVDDYEKRILIRKLKLLKGSIKEKPNSPQREVFENYLKKDPSEILRKFNL